MEDTRLVKGQCKCGSILTFIDGPLGYKTVCETCGASVRLKPETIKPKKKKRKARRKPLAASVCVTCPCGHQFVVKAHPIGTLLSCPACKAYLRMPDPSNPRTGGASAEVLHPTREIGAVDEPEPDGLAPAGLPETAPQPKAEPMAEILPEPEEPKSLDELQSQELLDFGDLEGLLSSEAEEPSADAGLVCPSCKSQMPEPRDRCPFCGVVLSQ